MKRNFLFIGYDSPVESEIGEYIRDRRSAAHFAHSNEQAIHMLDEFPIDVVVITLHKLEDAAILKYINQYYQEIKVLVAASKEFDDIIKVFNQGNYSMLRQPLKLEELMPDM
jgi:DNA-binding NtrC family response regulator